MDVLAFHIGQDVQWWTVSKGFNGSRGDLWLFPNPCGPSLRFRRSDLVFISAVYYFPTTLTITLSASSNGPRLFALAHLFQG
jgi:hypothetical protein